MQLENASNALTYRALHATVLAILLTLSATSADARSLEFLLRHKVQLKASFWGVTETDGVVAAVGLKGRVGISQDRTAWSTHAPDQGVHLLGAASGSAGLFTVGGKGFTSGTGAVFRADRRSGALTEIAQSNGPLYEIRFFNEMVGHAVGANGAMVRTEDGGETWKTVSSGTAQNLWGLKFTSPYTGLIGGGETPWQNQNKSSGIIRRTTDAGRTWNTVHTGNQRISDFSFVNKHIGFASGVGGLLLKSIDGGASWHIVGKTPLVTIVNALAFVDARCGLIVGAGGTAYMTRDGGVTWPGRLTVTKGSFLEALAPSRRTPDGYWVVGGDGTIGLIDLGGFCHR